MKKILIISALCLSLAYCIDHYIESERAEERRVAAQKDRFEKNKSIIREMVVQHSANYKWYQMFDRSDRLSGRPVMQADLENAWLSGDPIIFLGKIDDYRNFGASNYQVTVKPDIFSYGFWVSDVGLKVDASKSLIEKFVKDHPEVLSRRLASRDGAVAIIAKVNSIEKSWEGAGEDAAEISYGTGSLVEIRYLEGRLPLTRDDSLFSGIE